MMLALTVKEVQSSGSAVTFRLSGNRALTLPRQGKRRGRGEEREGEMEEEVHTGACRRLQLWCVWGRETVKDRGREFKRHGVCWLAGWTEGEREVCDSRAWQVRQNKPVVTHGLLHSLLWSDPAGQPTIWDGTTYSSNHLDYIQDQRRREDGVCVCGSVCVCRRQGAWRFPEDDSKWKRKWEEQGDEKECN